MGGGDATGGPFPSASGLRLAGFFFPLLKPVLGMGGMGVDMLLPKAETVAFMQDGQDPVIAHWDDVLDVAGDLMEQLDMYPLRFRVRSFPSEEQLAALR